jgi:gentisate 1,2-dioxygenase
MDPLIHEYSKNAIPDMTEVCPAIFPPDIYKNCECTKVFELDQKSTLQTSYPCSSPNLLANFVKLLPGDDIVLVANCTSHLFYVIAGKGVYCSSDLCSMWNEGDLFVLSGQDSIHLTSRSSEDSILYWVNDSPLLEFLGVKFARAKFTPSFFKKRTLMENLEKVRHDVSNHDNNRLGILLSNADTEDSTKTVTHVLWSLLNVLPAQTKQPPHKHNSVALDLCVSGGSEKVYTLMGPELDEHGWVKNPLRIDWETGGAFVTPPGWYHSHHNDSDVDALVLPIQDAGLYTYQRTLDLTFSKPC